MKNINFLILLGLFLLIISFSCSKSADKYDCALLEKIYKEDQLYRGSNFDQNSPYLYSLDSILKSKGYSDGLADLGKVNDVEEAEYRDQADVIANHKVIDYNLLDSTRALQKEIDINAIYTVIDIVNEIGMKGLNDLDSKCGTNSLLVFVHTPEELKEHVLNFITLHADSIDDGKYNHITTHLYGRINEPLKK